LYSVYHEFKSHQRLLLFSRARSFTLIALSTGWFQDKSVIYTSKRSDLRCILNVCFKIDHSCNQKQMLGKKDFPSVILQTLWLKVSKWKLHFELESVYFGDVLFLPIWQGKDREIWSCDGARFSCLRTRV